MQCSLTHSLRKWALENFTYMIIPPEKHNLRYNMKESFPIESSCRRYDTIISVRVKALAQHYLASVTLDKLAYVSRLRKQMSLILYIVLPSYGGNWAQRKDLCASFTVIKIFPIFSVKWRKLVHRKAWLWNTVLYHLVWLPISISPRKPAREGDADGAAAQWYWIAGNQPAWFELRSWNFVLYEF